MSGQAAAIASAENRKITAIYKAPGGADKTPAQIGFLSTCPSVKVPGDAPFCDQPVVTRADLKASARRT